MAKYTKLNKNVEMSNLTDIEIYGILKSNIPCILAFKQDNNIIDFIVLQDRLVDGSTNKIKVKLIDGTEETVIYDEVLDLIIELQKVGILHVQIEKNLFVKKEPLILLLDTIKKELVNSCVYIDYNDGVFSVVNKDLPKGLPDKLFYFEANDSVLIFTENGPQLIFDKFQSIEDVIC